MWSAPSIALCSIGADLVAGPGNVAAGSYDSGNPLEVVDTSSPLTLSAGQYEATAFSCGLGASSATSATITPFLATANGLGTYRIVAVGDGISYTGSQSFQPYAFGGTDTFAGDTLYAGFYWTTPSMYCNCPLGYAASGSAAVWTTAPPAPVEGATTSVPDYPSLTRAYEFSVTVTTVPEPSSLAMILGLGLGLLAYAWRRRK